MAKTVGLVQQLSKNLSILSASTDMSIRLVLSGPLQYILNHRHMDSLQVAVKHLGQPGPKLSQTRSIRY